MGFILTPFTALLLTIPYYNSQLYILSWIAFLPFLYYIFKIRKDDLSYKNIFFEGWSLGFWILVFSGNFLYHSINLYTEASFLVIVMNLILLFLLLSLIYGIFFLLYFYLQRKFFIKNKFSPFLFAFCWTLLELSRYYILSFFPIANPAYTQAEFLSFIQLAEVGGIWILTFILILVNSLLFQIIFYKRYKKSILLIILFISIFSFGYFRQQSNFYNFDKKKAENIKIGIITSEIEQNKKWGAEQLQKNIDLTLRAASELKQSQLIIAPETNITFDFMAAHSYRKDFLKKLASEFKTPLQFGSLSSKKGVKGRYNSSFLVSETGEINFRYDKNLLLYFGEIYPLERFLNSFSPFNFSSLNPGQKKTIFKNGDLKWKTVICSEILYPSFVKQKTAEIDFIVNQTNEAWFNNSSLLKNIMWQAAVLRAVENRVFVIKTGNRAHNGLIYPSGKYQKVNTEKNYHLLKLK